MKSCDRTGLSLLWVLFLTGVLIVACTGNSQDQTSGALRFSAVWPAQNEGIGSQTRKMLSDSIDVCTFHQIETIRAEVIDQDGKIIGTNQWPCSTPGHTGTIDRISAGNNYHVIVEGISQNLVQWRGRYDGITVVAGETYDCGTIDMFGVRQFNIMASAGSGGRIEPSGNVVVEEGTDQAFSIIADPGYQITELTIDGIPINLSPSYSFTGVTSDHSIDVRFELILYNITATASSGGTISPSGTITVGPGTDHLFTFEANPGYQIEKVTVDGRLEGVVPDFAFHSVNADHIISVSFIAVRYVDMQSPGSGDGTSWTQALQSIPEAITTAVNDNADEIWVRKGLYVLRESLQIDAPVKLYGGFEGTEIHRGQRRPMESTSTINGLNTPHAVTITADAILDGFIIINGGEMDLMTTMEGGGIFLPADENVSPTISNCVIRDNRAEMGAGFYIGKGNSPHFVNCEFNRNEANIGGGGYLEEDSSTRLTSCKFIRNSASEIGGGLINVDNSVIITNSLFRHNSAERNGAGIYNSGFAEVTITNCTFYENRALTSGGVAINSGSSMTISNSIFWHGTQGGDYIEISNSSGSPPSVTYSNVRGGYPGTGNIDADPLFTDRDQDLFFSLMFGSPCIDRGSDIAPGITDVDHDGRPRIVDGDGDGAARVDMGAYEYTP